MVDRRRTNGVGTAMALSRKKVLRAALELVDREGLDGLTMRGLGRALGVEAMSLYRYVDNKSDLLDGVFEVVASDVILPDATGDWHADAALAARHFYTALTRHPNVLPLFATRPAVTPAALQTLERALGLLAQDGASVDDALTMFNVIFAYLLGYATLRADAHEEVLVDYGALDSAEFPQLSQLRRVLDEQDVHAEFERGLEALLAGLTEQFAIAAGS